MRYIEAPEIYKLHEGESAVFLAGGITGTPNWQGELLDLIRSAPLVVFNPRRKHFPIGDASASRQQITWEFQHLEMASHILFWFPCESVCPIALFELGAWARSNKRIFVGVHPNYPRRLDVEVQMELARPDLKIFYFLPDLAASLLNFFS